MARVGDDPAGGDYAGDDRFGRGSAGEGRWEAFEPGGEGSGGEGPEGRKAPHDCDSPPPISQGWDLRSLGHPLTCRLDCWWCSEEVYLHTRGGQDFALFDALSWPWPAHSCWHERSEERGRALRQLESDLRARGYQGRARFIGIAPSAVPSVIPAKGRQDPPALQIRLSGTDHQMVDRAVRQITQFVSEQGRRPPLAVPLPVGKKESPVPGRTASQEKDQVEGAELADSQMEEETPGPAGEQRGQDPGGGSPSNGRPSGERSGSGGPEHDRFTEHVHHRAIEMWEAGPELIARLSQVQLPDGVDVKIRQATSR